MDYSENRELIEETVGSGRWVVVKDTKDNDVEFYVTNEVVCCSADISFSMDKDTFALIGDLVDYYGNSTESEVQDSITAFDQYLESGDIDSIPNLDLIESAEEDFTSKIVVSPCENPDEIRIDVMLEGVAPIILNSEQIANFLDLD